MIGKVYEVDPLVCGPLRHAHEHGRLRDGRRCDRPDPRPSWLSTPQAEKPPPIRKTVRVAEHGEGWGVPAEWN
jgi:hypothetical protein